MSEHFQNKKGNLTGSGLRELAQLVLNELPDGAVVAVASVALTFDPVADNILMEEPPEVVTESKHADDPLAFLAHGLERRVCDALYAATDDEDWVFNTEHAPAMLFSIESDCDYYLLVALAIDTEDGLGLPSSVDEVKLIGSVIQYIDEAAPAADCAAECDPTVYYMYGALTDGGLIYQVNFDQDK